MSAHTTVTDPVCGMSVEPADAAASVEREGHTYSFCSHGCHAAFITDPGMYLPSGEHTHTH
jgi:Cu+-exporting ATPase